MASLKINDTFNSYKELRQALDRYEIENRVQFWKRDAKKISSAETYAPQIYFQVRDYPDLEYYYLKFTCIHGGQPFRPSLRAPRSRRINRGTWKQDCKAEISVGLTKDRSALIINNIVDEHNHEIPSLEVYQQLPRQRRKLEPNDEKIQKAKKMKLHKPSQETKSGVLKNILKTNSFSRSNNFKKIAKLLTEKHNCVVDLQVDKEEKVYGFFFQDLHMKKYFNVFPEVLIMDGTYKLQNIDCCIYILSIENSFGTTNVVGVAVLTIEDKESVEWMMEKFKGQNSKWQKTEVVMTDKLTSDYQVVKKQFPGAQTLICQSHALQILKKEITTVKLNITLTESKDSLQCINMLMRASSEEEYGKILDTMEDGVPYNVMQYFYNWHEVRSEWVSAFTKRARKLINTKLENSHSKLKSVAAGCKNFNEFIEKLFALLDAKREEFKNELIKTILKTPRDGLTFHQHLTQFAANKIEPFLNSETICETKSLVVSATACSCDFFTLVKLPCKHVLSHRRSLDLALFDECLFAERWTKKYIRSAFGDLLLSDVKEEGAFSERGNAETEQEPTKTDKLEAQAVCLELAALCGEVSGSEFEERLRALKRLRECWRQGQEVVISQQQQDDVFDHDYTKKNDQIDI